MKSMQIRDNITREAVMSIEKKVQDIQSIPQLKKIQKLDNESNVVSIEDFNHLVDTINRITKSLKRN